MSLQPSGGATKSSTTVHNAKTKERVVAEMFDGREEDVVVAGAGVNFEALVPFKGGLLVNQQYAVTPKLLNRIIFEQGELNMAQGDCARVVSLVLWGSDN